MWAPLSRLQDLNERPGAPALTEVHKTLEEAMLRKPRAAAPKKLARRSQRFRWRSFIAAFC